MFTYLLLTHSPRAVLIISVTLFCCMLKIYGKMYFKYKKRTENGAHDPFYVELIRICTDKFIKLLVLLEWFCFVAYTDLTVYGQGFKTAIMITGMSVPVVFFLYGIFLHVMSAAEQYRPLGLLLSPVCFVFNKVTDIRERVVYYIALDVIRK